MDITKKESSSAAPAPAASTPPKRSNGTAGEPTPPRTQIGYTTPSTDKNDAPSKQRVEDKKRKHEESSEAEKKKKKKRKKKYQKYIGQRVRKYFPADEDGEGGGWYRGKVTDLKRCKDEDTDEEEEDNDNKVMPGRVPNQTKC